MAKNIIRSGAKSTPEVRHERDGLFVRYQDYYHKIKYADILYVEASGCYCDIYLRGRATPLTVVKRLHDFERLLPERLFVRIHRSYITKFVGNTVYFIDKEFPIGSNYRPQFLSRLTLL